VNPRQRPDGPGGWEFVGVPVSQVEVAVPAHTGNELRVGFRDDVSSPRVRDDDLRMTLGHRTTND